MTAAHPPGPWSPLAQPEFRTLWLAILVGNIGTWVHDVAAAWTMAGLTQSPLWVAAVQSATTLPMALLALVAGTLADIVDRRRYLIVVQVFMLLVAATLSVLAALDALAPPVLLALTFALGCGAAMAMPAQAAITPELVPREQLAPAVALHSVGMNIARSIGPALGGLVVAALGAAWAFGLNALSFVALAVALLWWRRPPSAGTLPPEGFGLALRAGLRYARHAGPLRAVLAKAACFFVFAAAPTALLPLLVRDRLGAGPGTFGLLLGSIGAGALLGALLLPRLRERLERDTMVLAASLLLAAAMLGLALLRQSWALSLVMLGNGLAWITVLSSLQIAAQSAVPGWVRARAMALYLVVFSLGMGAGSLLWGTVAQHAGLPAALVTAALALVAASFFARRFRLAGIETLDHAPSGHWPLPEAPGDTGGPVMVMVEYRIDAPGRELFLALMHDLGERRRRDGALQWGLVEDIAAPGEVLEWFLVGSWLEHLRQHERVTREEERLQAALRTLHRGDAPPSVRHFTGAGASPPRPPPAHAGDARVITTAARPIQPPGGNTMTNQSLFTTKDGTTLYFKDWGDRAGAVVVLCHGWPLSSDSWESQMLFLAENGYRVIAHDRRGHGRSSQPWHGNEMDTYADDLAQLLEHLDVRDISIFGFSTGGGEVARYIGRHGTKRVKKAGLISAVPPLMVKTAANPGGLPVEVFDGIRSGQLADRSQLYRDIPAGPFYGYNRPGSTPSQGIIDAWWLQGMMGGHRNTFECIKAFSETDFTEDLKKFDVPTLILHGDDDQIVPIGAAALESAKLVRDNTLVIYEGAPHGLTDTHKERFNADLLAFLRR